MTEKEFALLSSENPSELTEEEYLDTIRNLAEKIWLETQLEEYDSIDDGIDENLANHLYTVDPSRAFQLVSFSETHPKKIAGAIIEGTNWRETIVMTAREIMTQDIRREIMGNQQEFEEKFSE